MNESFDKKFKEFVNNLEDDELDMLMEMLEKPNNNDISVDKKKAYIIEALPGNKTRIVEDEA